MCEHRDALQAQIQVDKAESQYTVAHSPSDLERSHTVSEEAKKLQSRESLQIKKLKVALATETVNVEKERKAKQEAFKER